MQGFGKVGGGGAGGMVQRGLVVYYWQGSVYRKRALIVRREPKAFEGLWKVAVA